METPAQQSVLGLENQKMKHDHRKKDTADDVGPSRNSSLKVPHKEKDCFDIFVTTRCVPRVCLVLLFFTEISSRLCTMLHFQQNKMNKESLEHLKKMSGKFPSQGINERADSKPTQHVAQLPMSQKEKAIFSIFSKNLTQSAWDGTSIVRFQTAMRVAAAEQERERVEVENAALSQAVTCLKDLVLEGLNQQIQWLEACLRAQMEKDLNNPEREDLQLTSWRVKQYFQGIDAFPKEKQYSLCAWEIICMEIPRCFVLTDKLN
ncbi:interferon epsilon-like [Lepidochelys kempii]|uniref:interferon epsilon-like n=1 Tax=Lepidochelys kempii TaxID=8472 RepID=UPI003C70017B